jgi:regulator of sigma E protease
MTTIIVFFLILGLLVLVHEFGHFLAAKRNGIMVEEFGFGLPPRIWGKKFGETLYSLNLFPFGGFVKLYGEEYREHVDPEAKLKIDPRLTNRAFAYKKPWQKAVVVIGGVVGNFLLGWVLISFLFTQGVPTPINRVYVERVQAGSPASAAGLQEGDYIKALKVDNQTYQIKSTNELISLTKKFAGQEIVLVVDRNGQTVNLQVTPRENPPKGEGPLGVTITSFVEKKYPWYQAPVYGLIEAFKITERIISELFRIAYQLITFQKPEIEITGPIGIAQYTGQAVRFGKNAVLELIALLSLNLAVINILPFPALDGGRMLFVIYEWVTRRHVNQKVERYLNLIGIILLLSLAIIISVNDIIRIYRQLF